MNIQEAGTVIALLGQKFDSHMFIIKFLEEFPAEYGRLLTQHNSTARANAQISNFLRQNAAELHITQDDKETSQNIFSNQSPNATWHKN